MWLHILTPWYSKTHWGVYQWERKRTDLERRPHCLGLAQTVPTYILLKTCTIICPLSLLNKCVWKTWLIEVGEENTYSIMVYMSWTCIAWKCYCACVWLFVNVWWNFCKCFCKIRKSFNFIKRSNLENKKKRHKSECYDLCICFRMHGYEQSQRKDLWSFWRQQV